jgi:hypothetical protein
LEEAACKKICLRVVQNRIKNKEEYMDLTDGSAASVKNANFLKFR